MSQRLGYVIVAFGPIGMGLIHDRLEDWNRNLWLIAVLLNVGTKAAKDTVIDLNVSAEGLEA